MPKIQIVGSGLSPLELARLAQLEQEVFSGRILEREEPPQILPEGRRNDR